MNCKNLSAELNNGEAFLIVSPENRRYFTEFDSSDGYLLITKNESVFFTDSRYIEAARAKTKNMTAVELLTSFKEQIPEFFKKTGITKVYTEAERLTVSEYETIKRVIGCECAAEKTDALINSLRRKKSEDEKNKIIKAQRIAEKGFEYILTQIKPGITEKKLSLMLDFFMLDNGADGLSFDTIVVSGKNSSLPHGVPSGKKVENGDFVTMDFGAVFDGYHSDMTRTVAVGEVSAEQIRVYDTVLKAQLASLNILAPECSCKNADAAARNIISEAGFGDYFGHGTGHGVGIEIHEQPSLSPKSSLILSQGDIVTVEPGIYIPGKFGVRIEDMAFITENGCENLTKSDKSLLIL